MPFTVSYFISVYTYKKYFGEMIRYFSGKTVVIKAFEA
jgi:hypothetical protein